MSEITNAIKQICEEKGLSYEAVISTIESALAAAYRKDYGEKNQNIKVEYDPEKNTSKVFDIKTVVEDVPEEELAAIEASAEMEAPKAEGRKPFEATAAAPEGEGAGVEGEEEKHRFNPKTEIQISEAQALDKKYKLGDEIKTELELHDEYGRMAAQTAKQVIIQRLREAERDMVFGEFKDKEKEVITGFVQRREGRVVLVDLGKATGVVPPDEQIRGERYNSGERLKFYVKEVKITPRGPEIVLSRTSDEILKKVFYLEIPEISNNLVEIKSVAREAGSRAKVAVSASTDNIDPIGSCVGQRGSRIQTIIRELGGEKIDIIEYSEDVETFIANALAPAKVEDVKLIPEERQAYITVKDDQLSLAIGKDGQNVRLAAHLTGWKIDIAGDGTGAAKEKAEGEAVEAGAGSEEAEAPVAEADAAAALNAEAPGAGEEAKPKKRKAKASEGTVESEAAPEEASSDPVKETKQVTDDAIENVTAEKLDEDKK